ncbi:TlpA family protein disulfide reductase [Pedobacter jejuensis]|uniref:TlpA family protein disulfide reductase n=1 Tax=Pedobacter jejuensis TaxID=1268550 RepID=A0A3N0BLX3_9SPHI|nr:TlpA disulfide reductase family protein [Pedobacter jejuensis]RNL49759.1 TlpA family protein disulfide reductase [Pedobacter jejuensis]
MKNYLLIFLLLISIFAKAQSEPVKWATQETFFDDLRGKNLSDFEGVNLKGKAFYKDNLKNQIVLINFWFEACPPCVKEIPELNKLVDKYKTSAIRFIAITYDSPKQAAIFKKKAGYKYEIICLKPEEIRKLNINHGYPTNVLIGKNGKIIQAVASLSYSDEIPEIKQRTLAFEEHLKLEISKSAK